MIQVSDVGRTKCQGAPGTSLGTQVSAWPTHRRAARVEVSSGLFLPSVRSSCVCIPCREYSSDYEQSLVFSSSVTISLHCSTQGTNSHDSFFFDHFRDSGSLWSNRHRNGHHPHYYTPGNAMMEKSDLTAGDYGTRENFSHPKEDYLSHRDQNCTLESTCTVIRTITWTKQSSIFCYATAGLRDFKRTFHFGKWATGAHTDG